MKTVLSRLHPASAFVYLAGILIMAALNRHPWMTCTQLLCLGEFIFTMKDALERYFLL